MSEDELKSDSFLRQLAAFRPNPDVVNRDELLYQAGRASALMLVNRIAQDRDQSNIRAHWKPHLRRWQGAAALLAGLLILSNVGWVVTSPTQPRQEPEWAGPGMPLELNSTPTSPPRPIDPGSYVALLRMWNEQGSLPEPSLTPASETQVTPVTAGQLRNIDID